MAGDISLTFDRIFNGMSRDLQFFLLGVILMVIGLLIPKGIISFIVFVSGEFLFVFGIAFIIKSYL